MLGFEKVTLTFYYYFIWKFINEWMTGWMDGCRDGQMDGWNTEGHTVCSNILTGMYAPGERLHCFMVKTLWTRICWGPCSAVVWLHEMCPQTYFLVGIALQNQPLCSGRLLSTAIWFCLSFTGHLPIFPSCWDWPSLSLWADEFKFAITEGFSCFIGRVSQSIKWARSGSC